MEHTMTDLDDIIRTDLAALGAETARAIPGFDTVSARLAGAGGPYRDDQPGAEARRRALRDDRLRELALMPLAYERVFVHRVSRAGAGAAAILGIGVALAASADLWTQRLAYLLIGQPTAPLLAALLGLSTLAAYVLCGWIAERYYERRLRGALDAAGDAYADIDKLEAASPTREARALVDRVDGAAVALPLAGAITGGLALGLLAFFSDHGYSAMRLLLESADVLVPAAFTGIAAAWFIGVACAGERRRVDRSPLLLAAEHWLTLAAGGAAAVASLWFAARTSFALHAYGVIPGQTTSLALGAAGLAALVLPATWVALWWRRREHRRLGD
jgi:hypothetical protein